MSAAKVAAPAAAGAGKPPKDKGGKEKGEKGKGKGSDDEEVDPAEAAKMAAAELACSGCAEPCTLHPSYPEGVTKKLSKGAFAGSVKAYSLHFVLCTGVSGAKWPNRVEADPHGYAHAFNAAFEPLRKQCPFPLLMTLSDETSQDVDPKDSENCADILVFPLMLRYRNVKVAQLPALLQAECVQRKRAEGLALEHVSAGSSIVLVCNHKLRDDRCGRAGPMLITEFQKAFEDKTLDAQLADLCHATPTDAKAADAKAAAADAAAAALKRKAGAVVMGTSHVSGHKWAGNVLVYPAGRWYARVTPCHVHAIVDAEIVPLATGQGAVKPIEPLLRGAVTPLPPLPAATAPAAAAGAGAAAAAAAAPAGSLKW